MNLVKRTLAAAAVGVAALAGSASAQEQQGPTTLTAEEAAGVKKFFMFNACVQPKMPDQLSVLFGAITQEEAEKQVAAAIAECETSTGVKQADIEATRDAVVAKYGNDVNQIVANSYSLIYDDLTDDDKAVIKLLSDFRACAQTEQATYDAAHKAWYDAAYAEFQKKVAGGMSEQAAEAEVLKAMPAPQKPDIQATCITKVGVTDANAVQAKLDTLVGKYGEGVLNPPAPQN